MNRQLDIALPDERATDRLGEDLALAISAGDCLALYGDLGAGKSTLARALIRAVADDPHLEVPSPTFTLVQSYPLRIAIGHFDLYRIGDPDELAELGLDEALADGAVFIEWPQRAGDYLPPDAIAIRLEHQGTGRRAVIAGTDGPLDRITRSLEIRAFLEAVGRQGAERRFLLGDASVRAYETIHGDGDTVELLMNAPRRELGPVIRDGKRYAEIARVTEDIGPFIALDLFLAGRGFRVPAILAQDQPHGLALIEYLGDEGLVDAAGLPVPERWETAIDCLFALHRQTIPTTIRNPGAADHIIPPFDADAMMIEVELFLEWYLPFRLDHAATPEERSRFEDGWRRLIGMAQAAESGLLLRDFHSPNILWQAEAEGIDRIGMIDFQDAMIGPVAYDIASLVQDARITIAADFAERLVRRYETARLAEDPTFDAAAFRQALAIMQAQRATKLLGLFVRLRDRDGKSGYIRHLPRIKTYLREALAHEVLRPLQPCYTEAEITLDES